MIYAAETQATDNALTVGGIDGKLLNTIRAFESKAEYNTKLDALWAEGRNLIRIPRKRVDSEYGRSFCIRNDGTVCHEYDA
jgi:hypothetical protein